MRLWRQRICCPAAEGTTRLRWIYERLRWSISFLGVSSLLWLLLRSGARPTRIVYPCQQVAVSQVNAWLGVSLIAFLAWMRKRLKRFLVPWRALPIALAATGIAGVGVVVAKNADWARAARLRSLQEQAEKASETLSSTSYIFFVEKGGGPQGLRFLALDRLIDLMGVHGLYFYRTEKKGIACSPTGLVSANDVVVIKVNCQWDQRGGTNTDLLKGLIYRITQHPDGFTGEIVVADNGQDVNQGGSLNWENNNAEDHGQSAQGVVNLFSGSYKVSTYLWTPIRNRLVNEFDQNDTTDGYVRAATPDPQSSFRASYPKFTTRYGTRISLKRGIYTGTYDKERLKVINVPVLKTHSGFGMTACVKHYIGVQSQPLSDGHSRLSQGAMGTLLADLGLPVLNVLDAIWVNANPKGTAGDGPPTSYAEATRLDVLMASVDPVALDAWAANNVMIPAMRSKGYTDPNLADFWGYLQTTKNILVNAGYPVTTDSKKIIIFRADRERPVLTDLALDGSERATLKWVEIAPGSFVYTVEQSSDLLAGWESAPGTNWPISETQWTSSDPLPAGSCFYRVRRDPAGI